jgi:hypothetical protein
MLGTNFTVDCSIHAVNVIGNPLTLELQIAEHGGRAGVSNIEREFTSSRNPRLIFHDSQGFCHGSGDNFEVVKYFIQTRSQMPNLKDRLHVIWFDGPFGYFRTGLLIAVRLGCAPPYPGPCTVEVYSKLLRRFFR